MTLTLSESWFAALDERRIGSGNDSWVIHVSGIWTVGNERWIQLHDADNSSRAMVLRVSSLATADDVVAALAMAPPHPMCGPEIMAIPHAA